MKVIYAKTILHCYPKFQAVLEVLDDLVEKKAIAGFEDFRPCDVQAEEILKITEKKVNVVKLKSMCDCILKTFNEEERAYLDYKYFKQKPAESYSHIDFTTRNYYRKQVRLATVFANKLKKVGYTDQKFESLCQDVYFFSAALSAVKEWERAMHKNKPVALKQVQSNEFKPIKRVA